jgi:hypothetical protein
MFPYQGFFFMSLVKPIYGHCCPVTFCILFYQREKSRRPTPLDVAREAIGSGSENEVGLKKVFVSSGIGAYPWILFSRRKYEFCTIY